MTPQEIANKARAEAASIEAGLPELRVAARIGAKLAKEIPDQIARQVDSRFRGGRLRREIIERYGPDVPDTAGAMVAEGQHSVIEAFGDRLIEFVESTTRSIAAGEARAKALREMADALDASNASAEVAAKILMLDGRKHEIADAVAWRGSLTDLIADLLPVISRAALGVPLVGELPADASAEQATGPEIAPP